MPPSRFAADPRPRLRKAEFKQRASSLHTHLLQAQQQCRQAGKPVVILVSGVEAAGKSEVVNRLSSWLDMRYVRTLTYWQESDEERSRPRDWRYWRGLPGKGEMSILFSSWYMRTILQALPDELSGEASPVAHDQLKTLKQQCEHITRFEKLLRDEGVVLIKLWFHIGKKAQKKRLQEKKAAGHYVNPCESVHARFYDQFVDVAERVLERTDTLVAPWHIVQSEDELGRDLRAGEIILEGLRRSSGHSLEAQPWLQEMTAGLPLQQVEQQVLPAPKYKKALARYQRELGEIHWRRWDKQRSAVLLFEGWDAAGKGGAIRRLTAAMDARLYRVIPVAAPTDEELAHHYLWRFWRQLPRDGYITIYDRSWYGRVLVERVEGFASDAQWQNAYGEINDFEQQLINHGITLVKFWLQITPHEQLRRFQEREQLAHKRHKISDEDWRNRERWTDYELALEDMLARTSTAAAPWHVIAADNKRHARVEILKTVCQRLSRDID
ncbi:MAG: polyphosphate:AMP phosphotransferase [Gammaproteobacteria bacterium]|nr:polyphosphate:AMP phosphotransferase [Gammaproteobacteria bacterium]